tara:strand:- start:1818 stop:2471 length:654 start_codon:yes stop_codon:yes gene_type:complete
MELIMFLSTKCHICKCSSVLEFLEADNRKYFLCENCEFIFVPKQFWVSKTEEKLRYKQHRNDSNDKGYVEFLSQITEPIKKFIQEGSHGIDYGCGPNSVLSDILIKAKMHMTQYDPFFYPKFPNDRFDFLLSTETFEHFQNPLKEIRNISSIVHSQGLIGIMTSFWQKDIFIKNWHYRRDKTHICFYTLRTFEYIADIFQFEILYTDKNRIVIFKKK